MTFELSSKQEDARDVARAFAHDRLIPLAASIDEAGAIPPDLLDEPRAFVAGVRDDGTSLAVIVEELAAASAAAAAASALDEGAGTSSPETAGLRGFVAPDTADTRARLTFAAIALGIGRQAIEIALDVLRENPRSAQEQEKPHWVVADAATELAAARMLTLQAAQRLGGDADPAGFVAIAKLAATKAAQQAVDAALRVAGANAFVHGTPLERLTRDIRAVSLMMGTEEDLRAAAATTLLPG